GHYRRALELMPHDGQRQRLSIVLALGIEQQRSGELETARHTFDDLVADARRTNDAEFLARAALGLHGLGYTLDSEPLLIGLFDEALEKLETVGAGTGPLAARLLAASSRERAHHVGASRGQGEELSARAVELA